jgi:cobalt/nickel transport protein
VTVSRSRWVDVLLLAAVVAVFAVPLGLRLGVDPAAGEAYGGSDAAAETVVGQVNPDYRPWFSPLFEPSSGEVESGLFALQAAVGAGVFGFVLGRLSARRRATAGAGRTPEAVAEPGDGD